MKIEIGGSTGPLARALDQSQIREVNPGDLWREGWLRGSKAKRRRGKLQVHHRDHVAAVHNDHSSK